MERRPGLLPLLPALVLAGCAPRQDAPSEAEVAAGRHLMAMVRECMPEALSAVWSVRHVNYCPGLACVEVLSPLAEGGFLRGAGYNEPPEDFRGRLVMRITVHDRNGPVPGHPYDARVVRMRDDAYTYVIERDMAEPCDITLKEDYRYIAYRLMTRMRDFPMYDHSIRRSALGRVTDAEILGGYAWMHSADPYDRNVLLQDALERVDWKNRGVRAGALAVLGALAVSDPAIIRTIRSNLGNTSQAVRSNAAWALGKLGKHGAVALEDLRKLEASDKCPAVRHAARRAILRITGEWREPEIHPVLQEPQPGQGRAAPPGPEPDLGGPPRTGTSEK